MSPTVVITTTATATVVTIPYITYLNESNDSSHIVKPLNLEGGQCIWCGNFGCLIEFEAINEEILPLLIEQAEDSQNENEVIYKVKSFTTDDIIYNVSVIEDKMKAYNCPDFTWNNIACEHMYLLKRYNRNIISTDLPTPEVFIDNTRTEQQQPIEIELQAFPQRNPHPLTDSQIQNMQNNLGIILNNNNNQPVNQNSRRR